MENKDYAKIIRRLKKDEKVFIGFIKLVPPANSSQIRTIKEHIKDFNNNDEVNEAISFVVSKRIESLLNRRGKQYGALGKELPDLMKEHNDIILDKTKRKLIKKVSVDKLDNFYAYSKKEIVNLTSDWIEKEEDAVEIIQTHHRILESTTFNNLLSKIADGVKHENLKKLRESSPTFLAKELMALDLNNPDERHRFINSIARSTSLTKYVDTSNLVLTLEDLKKLPSMRRFNFLCYLYQPLLGRLYRNGRFAGFITAARVKEKLKKGKITRLPIQSFPRDDLKDLLFTVAVHKNELASAWWKRYEEFFDIAEELEAK